MKEFEMDDIKALETHVAYLEKELQELEAMPKEDFVGYWKDKYSDTVKAYAETKSKLEKQKGK